MKNTLHHSTSHRRVIGVLLAFGLLSAFLAVALDIAKQGDAMISFQHMGSVDELGEIVFVVDPQPEGWGLELGFINPDGENFSTAYISIETSTLRRFMGLEPRLAIGAPWAWDLSGSSLHSELHTPPSYSGYPLVLVSGQAHTCRELQLDRVTVVQPLSPEYVLIFGLEREAPYEQKVALLNVTNCTIERVFPSTHGDLWQVSTNGMMATDDQNGIAILDSSMAMQYSLPGEGAPVWSPDGGWILLRSLSSLIIMRPDGSDRQVMFETNGPYRHISGGSWSPDGQSIVFSRSNIDTGITELMIADIATGDLRMIHRGASSPHWRWSIDSEVVDALIAQLRNQN